MFVVKLSYEQGNSHNNHVRNDVIGALNYRNPCAGWMPVC